MRIAAAFLALVLTVPAFGDAVEEVRQAETGFAKAFADRDKAKFFSFVAPDAVFISALGTLRGRDAVVARWSRMFDNVPVAPFSWGPERVEVTADGKIGFSMGPIYDPQGKHGGYYSSIWQKQADGAWKIIVDGPGNPTAPLPQTAAKLEEGFVPTADGGKLYYRKLSGGPVTIIAPLDFVFHEPLQQFADIATIITFDPRNRGRSSRIQPATIAKDVEDFETIRAALKVDKFVPLGWSYFGKVVAMYAAAHPEHVSRVIQIGPGANDMKNFPGAADGYFGAPAEDVKALEAMRAAGAAKEKPADFCDAYWKVTAYRMVGDAQHAGRFDRSFCKLENEWGVNFFAMMETLWPTILGTSLTDEELKKIAMPVLTIHGTEDRNAVYPGGKAWVASLPQARLVTVPGAAHSAWLDDPIIVFGSIRHFLRGEWPLGSETVTASIKN